MKIYFIRHGQTNYNLLDLCNDDPTKEVYLTELGKKQAEEIGDKLKNEEFDMVFVSELPRTLETAKIILKDKNQEIRIDKRINDRKTGFEGHLALDFYKATEKDFLNFKHGDGESFKEERTRVFSFLKDLKKQEANKILVVTHSEIIKIIKGYFTGSSDQEIWNTGIIKNCEIYKVII